MATTTQPIILLLTEIHCVKDSAESGKDEVWFEIVADGVLTPKYYNNPIKMKNDDSRAVNLQIDCTYLSSLTVKIREKDAGSNKDDYLGDIEFHRGDPLAGVIRVHQTTGKKRAIYELHYRVVSKPIPTLRVHGIFCHKESSNCDDQVKDAIVGVGEQVLEGCAAVLEKHPRPSRKAIGKAFEVAAGILAGVAELGAFIAKAIDGPDDVYMQQILGEHDGAGGGFFPPPGGQGDARTCEMVKEQEVCFDSGEWKAGPNAEYYRIPLDKGTGKVTGETTIQIREHDVLIKDISMGHLTIDAAKYNEFYEKGAQVYLCDEYFKGQRQRGQGALYSVCYSIGLEDWAKDANEVAQLDEAQ